MNQLFTSFINILKVWEFFFFFFGFYFSCAYKHCLQSTVYVSVFWPLAEQKNFGVHSNVEHFYPKLMRWIERFKLSMAQNVIEHRKLSKLVHLSTSPMVFSRRIMNRIHVRSTQHTFNIPMKYILGLAIVYSVYRMNE